VNYFGTFAHGIILWCMLYYLPLYYEGVKDLSPIMAGVAVFPQTFTVTPASITVGILVTLTGRFRWSLWAGWVFTTAGTGIMYLLDVHTSTVKWIFLNLLGGLGTGMLFPSMGFAIQASSSDENMSIAVAMFSFIRSVGQAFGVAIGGVIFQNALKKELAKFAVLEGRASELTQDAVAIVQVIKGLPKESELRMALVEGYAKALKPVWLAMMGFAAAAMLLAFATEKLDINRELKTEQGLREKKKQVPEGETGDVKA